MRNSHSPSDAPENSEEETALQLLGREDEIIRDLFSRLSNPGPPTNPEYGDLSKALIRHVAVREAALVDICATLDHAGVLPELTERMHQEMEGRRTAMDRVYRMSEGVPRLNLNQGQDFDGALTILRNIVDPEIERDLRDVIPRIEQTLSSNDHREQFHSSDYLLRHAPTHVTPSGPRWYERAPITSRIVALFVNLRDYPTVLRKELRPRRMAAAHTRRVPPATSNPRRIPR
jgi:hypothetical protein